MQIKRNIADEKENIYFDEEQNILKLLK